ncbi:hypothetical protein AB4120_00010 [Cupriavidus sp. 2KB_3]|uniref:hypothetical protein n=1 Tax=Cupriavidus sp. 2KB_3 TaxID=3232980 RepID=UPI003F8DE62E
MTLNFYRSKLLWIAAAVLLIAGYYELKDMMSVYKTDFGNGVIIYADDYVKTGRWVFDCEHTRLISRESLPVPFSDLERTEEFDIWDGYLKTADQQPAKEALAAITSVPHWYENLRYLYSGLDDYSDLSAHIFDLVAEHAGRSWGVGVRQSLSYYGKTQGFTLSIEPYDPETYVDYDKAFQAAIKSCPAPQ